MCKTKTENASKTKTENVCKTKIIIVSSSRTMHPQSPSLTIVGTVLEKSDDLDILE